MMGIKHAACVSVFAMLFSMNAASQGLPDTDGLARIRPGITTGFSNAGWKYDRYTDLPSLDAHTRMTLAELKGPGVIRHIHMTRHQPEKLASRGVVLEIRFDGADTPAVMCPVADFFGDGCNGEGGYFSSLFIECAPWSYNGYFSMPFAESARVILHNTTDRDLMDYSYVEWENLPEWNEELGYFHATYERRCIQLTRDSDEIVFEVQGTGHLLGRQYSIITDEPLFRGFNFVMEGNNEVDIDGKPRALDYLGTEDSFTFSWGFRETFTGLRSGMPLVEHGDLNRLSIYRFHDHMPIRFTQSLRWHINWRHESYFTKQTDWAEAVARGGCRVDYAMVHYWYQSVPGGFRHAPLPALQDRSKVMLHSSDRIIDLDGLFRKMDVDPELANTFDSEADLERIRIVDAYAGTHPFWIDRPEAEGGHPGNPNPGKRGILAVHPKSVAAPCWIVRKAALPADRPAELRLAVSGDPYENPGKSDFLLRAGVFDGENLAWFQQEVIEAGPSPSQENWRVLAYNLASFAGKTVAVVLRVSYGGPNGVNNEEAFFDEISVEAKQP